MNESLKILHLHGNLAEKISLLLADGIINNKSIDSLYFEGLKEDQCIQNLALIFKKRESRIKNLFLNNCIHSKEGINFLADSLKYNQSMKILILEENNLKGKISDFCENLKTNKSLEILSLIENELSDEDVTHLSEAIKKNKNLKKLFIGMNDFSTDALQYFSLALRENNTIDTLSFNSNIGNLVAPHPFQGNVKFSPKLYLKFSRFQKRCGKIFSDILLFNSSALTSLDLSNNELGDDSAQPIFESLQVNRYLKNLKLDNNQITDSKIKLLSETLEKNKTLVFLSLRDNFISDLSANFLCDALFKNNTLLNLKLGLKINQNGELFNLLSVLQNDNSNFLFSKVKELANKSTISTENQSKLNFLLQSNHPWTPEIHLRISNNTFIQSVYYFILSLKPKKIKIPKYILFYIIRMIDRKSFFGK